MDSLETMTVSSNWDAPSEITTGSIPLQLTEDRKSFVCPAHPVGPRYSSPKHYCETCEAEFQTKREELRQQRSELNKKLQELPSSKEDAMEQLDATLKQMKSFTQRENPVVPSSPPGELHTRGNGNGRSHCAVEDCTEGAVGGMEDKESKTQKKTTRILNDVRASEASVHTANQTTGQKGMFPPMLSQNMNAGTLGVFPGSMPGGFLGAAGLAATGRSTLYDAVRTRMEMQRMQYIQDWMMYQREQECLRLQKEVRMLREKNEDLHLENALLTQKLAQKDKQMEYEIKMIKLTTVQSRSSSRAREKRAEKLNDQKKSSSSSSEERATQPEAKENSNEAGIGNYTSATGGAFYHYEKLASRLDHSKEGSSATGDKESTTRRDETVADSVSNKSRSSRSGGEKAGRESDMTEGNNSKVSSSVANNKSAGKFDEPIIVEHTSEFSDSMQGHGRNSGSPTSSDVIRGGERKELTGLNVEEKKVSTKYEMHMEGNHGDRKLNMPVTKRGSVGQDSGDKVSVDKPAGTPERKPLVDEYVEGNSHGELTWSFVTVFTSGGEQGPSDSDKSKGTPTAEDEDDSSLNTAPFSFADDLETVSNKSMLDSYGDRGFYTGAMLRSTGMPHGAGKMIYEEPGRAYEGEWHHGRWSGLGEAAFENGDTYLGGFHEGQRHGQGRYEWLSGRVYEGAYRNNKRHGYGRLEYEDGTVYEGRFVNGNRVTTNDTTLQVHESREPDEVLEYGDQTDRRRL